MARTGWLGLSILVCAALLLASCAAPAASPSAPAAGERSAAPAQSDAQAATAGNAASSQDKSAASAGAAAAPASAASPATAGASQEIPLSIQPGEPRKIVKNGTMKLAVADTNVAVGRITQIAADSGGYILSSKAWQENRLNQPQTLASITLSVPSAQFESTLNRLRGIAVRVLDETASGEDVTSQYVDLESRLKNLQATRDRVRTFLDQAKTVEEALKVNDQLATVEGQIEETQGKINYLAGRSAYSTIAVDLEPDLVALTPTPTPTPAVWNPGQTFERASSTLQKLLQTMADILIWFVVTVLPILLVIGLIAWAFYRLWARFAPRKQP